MEFTIGSPARFYHFFFYFYSESHTFEFFIPIVWARELLSNPIEYISQNRIDDEVKRHRIHTHRIFVRVHIPIATCTMRVSKRREKMAKKSRTSEPEGGNGWGRKSERKREWENELRIFSGRRLLIKSFRVVNWPWKFYGFSICEKFCQINQFIHHDVYLKSECIRIF